MMNERHAVEATARGLFAGVVVAALALGSGCERTTGDPTPPASEGNGKTLTNRISIPADVRGNLGISFVRVERRAVADTVRLPGQCDVASGGRNRYRAVFAGRVKIAVEPLQRVKAGDLLFELDAPGWRERQSVLSTQVAASETAAATEMVAAAMFREAKANLDVAKQRVQAHAIRVRAAQGHLEELGKAEKVWEVEIERLKNVVSRGGGGAGRVAETRGILAATRVEIAKAREDVASLDATSIDLAAAVARIQNALPRYEAEVNARAAEAVAARERFRITLTQVSASLGSTSASLRERNDAGVERWRRIERVAVVAVSPGRVGRFEWSDGDWIDADTVVISTVDRSRIVLHASLLQGDLAALSGVRTGRIVPASGDGTPVDAAVTFGVEGDPGRRTFPVHATPLVPADWLRPGVAAFLELTREGGRPDLAVPMSSVIPEAGKRVLFKRDPANADEVIRLEVEVGVDDGAWIVVEGGVMEGDEVVAHGAYELGLTGLGKAPAGGHFHADGTWHGGAKH